MEYQCGGSFKKTKIDLPHDPAILLLGIYPKKCKSSLNLHICTPMCIAALFTIAKIQTQLRCPSPNEWIKKLWHIYAMEYSFSHKEK
jgi:hypothetical protein